MQTTRRPGPRQFDPALPAAGQFGAHIYSGQYAPKQLRRSASTVTNFGTQAC